MRCLAILRLEELANLITTCWLLFPLDEGRIDLRSFLPGLLTGALAVSPELNCRDLLDLKQE